MLFYMSEVNRPAYVELLVTCADPPDGCALVHVEKSAVLRGQEAVHHHEGAGPQVGGCPQGTLLFGFLCQSRCLDGARPES